MATLPIPILLFNAVRRLARQTRRNHFSQRMFKPEIKRIVSVGERVAWSSTGELHSPGEVKAADKEAYEGFEFLVVENVQDNGVDALTVEFERCLEFIGEYP